MNFLRAKHSSDFVYVYQAFTEFTAHNAVKNQTFVRGEGFSFDRMSWPKLSFGWMLYRSGFARKTRQEAVLEIKITHDFFNEILCKGVFSSFQERDGSDKTGWSTAILSSDVVLQWDPDRDLNLRKTGDKTLQFGLRGDMLLKYAQSGIKGIQDITNEVRTLEKEYLSGVEVSSDRLEKMYKITENLENKLLIDA